MITARRDNQIRTTVPSQTLRYQPGGPPTVFEVTVGNQSDRFASFQLELLPLDDQWSQNRRWYEVYPQISSKLPPGDSSRFQIAIVDTPTPGFSGRMPITVQVFSLELGRERRVVNLALEPGGNVLAEVRLPSPAFTVRPLERLEIPFELEAAGQKVLPVTVQLRGLPSRWLQTSLIDLQVPPQRQLTALFVCQIPVAAQVESRVYPFTVEVAHPSGDITQATGTVTVQPAGQVAFTADLAEAQLPSRQAEQRWSKVGLRFPLSLQNQSNLPVQAQLRATSPQQSQLILQLWPHQLALGAGETAPVELGVGARQPWLGRRRPVDVEVEAVVTPPSLPLEPDRLALRLWLLPRIPLWGQGVLALVLLYLLWWASWLNPGNLFIGHRQAVKSVTFNGTASEVISGADDQQLIRWRVPGFFNPFANPELGTLGQSERAVRVVRYRPVDNNWVAAGLENGEIQLWQLSQPRRSVTFAYRSEQNQVQRDNRVMALAFTADSGTLFSAHGDGTVLRWGLDYLAAGRDRLYQPTAVRSQSPLTFAIYGIALAGPDQTHLVIGGQRNQLQLWDWQADRYQPVAYPYPGGPNDYLTSVAIAPDQPYRLVTTDTQGRVLLWNLEPCLGSDGPCEILDRWEDGHDGQPVRAAALSDNGCYLATAGEDNRVRLWPLGLNGRRLPDYSEGLVMLRSRRPFRAVAATVWDQRILVAAGNDNSQVQVRRRPLLNPSCDQSP